MVSVFEVMPYHDRYDSPVLGELFVIICLLCLVCLK